MAADTSTVDPREIDWSAIADQKFGPSKGLSTGRTAPDERVGADAVDWSSITPKVETPAPTPKEAGSVLDRIRDGARKITAHANEQLSSASDDAMVQGLGISGEPDERIKGGPTTNSGTRALIESLKGISDQNRADLVNSPATPKWMRTLIGHASSDVAHQRVEKAGQLSQWVEQAKKDVSSVIGWWTRPWDAPAPEKKGVLDQPDPDLAGAKTPIYYPTPLEFAAGECVKPGSEEAVKGRLRASGAPVPGERGSPGASASAVPSSLVDTAVALVHPDARKLVRGALDTYLAAGRVIPETLKTANQIFQLITLGLAPNFTDELKQWSDALGGEASQKARQEADALSYMLKDQRTTPAQITAFLLSHPGFAVDTAIPSMGSMLIAVGGGTAGSQIARVMAARRAATAAELAAAGDKGAEWGSALSNALMNAGQNFDETDAGIVGKLFSAAAAGVGTAIVGKVTEGGVAGQLAKGGASAELARASGKLSPNPLVNAGWIALKNVAKEGAQEYGEQWSQELGQQPAETGGMDWQSAAKQANAAAIQGGVMGAMGLHGIGEEFKSPQRHIADAINEQGDTFQRYYAGTPIEPVGPWWMKPQGTPTQQRKDATTRFDELAAAFGLDPEAARAVKAQVAAKPADQVPGFLARVTGALARRGLFARDPAAEDVDALGHRLRGTQDHPVAGAPAAPEPARGGAKDDQEPLDAGSLLGAPPEGPAPIDEAAHEAATSPNNELPQPTAAQKEAGNYQKGHTTALIPGLNISIENPAESTRSGVSPDGTAWSNTLQHHYGYIRGTEGHDGDHVDLFIKPGTPDGYGGRVFVIDQRDPKTGRFDEHKVMVGFASEQEARSAYQSNYDVGWNGLDRITGVDMPTFKEWIKSGNHKAPFSPNFGKAEEQSAAAPAAAIEDRGAAAPSLSDTPDFRDTFPAPIAGSQFDGISGPGLAKAVVEAHTQIAADVRSYALTAQTLQHGVAQGVDPVTGARAGADRLAAMERELQTARGNAKAKLDEYERDFGRQAREAFGRHLGLPVEEAKKQPSDKKRKALDELKQRLVGGAEAPAESGEKPTTAEASHGDEERRQAGRRQERLLNRQGEAGAQPDEPWHESPFAPRIDAMVARAEASTHKNAAEAARVLRAGFASDAKAGRIDEQGVEFRERWLDGQLEERSPRQWKDLTPADLAQRDAVWGKLPEPIAQAAADKLNELGERLAALGFTHWESVNASDPAQARDLAARMREIFRTGLHLAPSRYAAAKGYKNFNPNKLARFEAEASSVLGIDTKAHPGVDTSERVLAGGVKEKIAKRVAAGARWPRTINASGVLAALMPHGLALNLARELSVERPFGKVHADGRRSVALVNPTWRGNKLFREGGLEDMQDIGDILHAAGYVRPASVGEGKDYEFDGEEARALIQRELDGVGDRAQTIESEERQWARRAEEAQGPEPESYPSLDEKAAQALEEWRLGVLEGYEMNPADFEDISDEDWLAIADPDLDLSDTRSIWELMREWGWSDDDIEREINEHDAIDDANAAYRESVEHSEWSLGLTAAAERGPAGPAAAAGLASEERHPGAVRAGLDSSGQGHPAGRPIGAREEAEVGGGQKSPAGASAHVTGGEGAVHQGGVAAARVADSAEAQEVAPGQQAENIVVRLSDEQVNALADRLGVGPGRSARMRRTLLLLRDAAEVHAAAQALGIAEAPDPLLNVYSTADLQARDLAVKAKEQADRRAELSKRAAEAKDRQIREDKWRADQTVDGFQLGQSAEEQLAGQRDIFSPPTTERDQQRAQVRDEQLIELRKRESILEAILKCVQAG